MEFRIEPRPYKMFVPFTLHIEVKTKDELAMLWHRFNIAMQTIMDQYTTKKPQTPFPSDVVSTQSIWRALHEEVVNCGLANEIDERKQ